MGSPREREHLHRAGDGPLRPGDLGIGDPLALLDAAVADLGGQRRDGQHELTAAIAGAIAEGHHLVAEAPTGSGKSLAYLAPAVASGMKVVVATSTIALQTQLLTKDLPTLLRASPRDFSFALLKGRSNYVCRAKLRAAEAPDALFETPVGAGFAKHLDAVRTFAMRSDTGDRAELPVAIPAASWAAVSCTSVECPGRNECADGEECFAEEARTRARGADVLVVNHALYCAHLAAGGYVLPEHDVLVLDEAHAFADNATDAFGDDLPVGSLERLGSMCRRAGVQAEAVSGLIAAADKLDRLLPKREGVVDLARDEELSSALQNAAGRVATVWSQLLKAEDAYGKRTARIAQGRLEALRSIASPTDADVVWVETSGRTVRIRRAPIAPGEVLAASLLALRPVIAVSATLGGAPPFAKLAQQLGFVPGAAVGKWESDDEGHRTSGAGRGYAAVRTASSFDWREQGRLYVARDLPAPGRGDSKWLDAAGERLCALVNAAGGRALVLCTSNANVKVFAELLRTRTDHDVLAQGDMDVGKLTAAFVEDETSVLVGTRTFWAGIDAPGVACVLVVIDKIPFPVPTDPLVSARRDRAEARGVNPFFEVDLPAAALVLAQGAGRLLRRDTDRGVVAVLDSRLATRDYRTELLAAMPPLRRTVDLAEVCTFLEEATAHLPKPEPRVVAAPPDVAPSEVFTDLSARESKTIRDAIACPACGAAVGARCTDPEGLTLAFVHAGRVATPPPADGS